MNKYYVYVLLDSSKMGDYIYQDIVFEYEPFYIGKGCGNRIKHTLYDKKAFKYSKIKNLKDKDIDIIAIKLLENLDNETAFENEKMLISKIGRRDLNKGPLVNMTDGGDGRLYSYPSAETKIKTKKTKKQNNKGFILGSKHSIKTIEKMKKAQSGSKNGFFGKEHTNENKDIQSNLVSGYNHPFYKKTHTDDIKIILKEKRSNLTDDMLKNACKHFNKKISMYDLNFNYIKTFESVKQAADELDMNESIISKCCRGDIKNPTRYYFKYIDLNNNIKNNKYLINNFFMLKNIRYTVVNRFKTTTLIKNDTDEILIKNNMFKAIEYKDTNDLYFIEFANYIKKIDNNFKINYDNYTITKGDIIFYYYKLYKNSEIFKNKNDIYNTKTENTYHVYEDVYIKKGDIIKSRINNILNQTSNVLYARKCEIYIPTFKETKDFLILNHIQGHVRYKYAIGLKYNNTLVSIMTFGSLRKNLGNTAKDGYYEMLRFCSSLNYNIVGGASKIFKYFCKEYNPIYIISYADCTLSNGNLYKKLNFDFINRTIPNYYYIIDNYNKENRFKHRKDILITNGGNPDLTEVEIQHQKGLYRIWDLGSYKFGFNNKK